jgi:hypothetical protein
MVKVVINKKFGGFGLSQKVLERLKEQGWTVSLFREDHHPLDEKADLLFKPVGTTFGYVREGLLYINWWKYEEDDKKFRTRKDIVTLVEELGSEANGEHASLEVVNVDDDYNWEITDYDGFEDIRYNGPKNDYRW